MKISWGTGIAIFYGLFVVGMVGLVIASSRQDPGLVAKNYYEADLGAQKTHDQRQNSLALETDVLVKLDPATNQIRLQFPKNLGQATGSVLFLRPSGSSPDFSQKIAVDTSNLMLVPTDKMATGLWRMTVNWEAGGRSYLKELPITI